MDPRFFRFLTALGAVTALAAVLTACGGSSTAPTTTTPPDKTESFSSPDGVPLVVGGTDFRTFTAASGEIDVNLIAATGVTASVPVFIGLGTPTTDGSVCSLSSTASGIAQAGQGFAVSAAGSGSFCVAIQDVYSLGPITWMIQVLHH